MKKRILLVSLTLVSIFISTANADTLSTPKSNSAGCSVPASGITTEFQRWNDVTSERVRKYFEPYQFPEDRFSEVEMSVNKLGFIENVHITSSSWSVEGDVSALEACWNSGPLPAVPDIKYSLVPPPLAGQSASSETTYSTCFKKGDNTKVFGGAISYFKQNPSQSKKFFAVHAIPLAVIDRYPASFSSDELSSSKNVLVFPKNSYQYENTVKAWYSEWQEFFGQNPKASRADILSAVQKRLNKRLFEK